MRIIQIVPTLRLGGLQKFTVELSNEIESSGHEVHLIILDKKKANDIYRNLSNKLFLPSFI